MECARRAKLYFDCEDGVIQSNSMFCPAHTPLLVKKNIEHEEDKTRDMILKYLKNLKRFLKGLGVVEEDKSKKKIEDMLTREERGQSSEEVNLDYFDLIKFFSTQDK